MEKEQDDTLDRLRKAFSGSDVRFHVLEERVPVEEQMEYFKYSERVRQEPLDQQVDFIAYWDELCNPEILLSRKKYILSLLASSQKVEAYRFLERYVQHPQPELSNWAHMALLESRIVLESEFSEQKQVYISSGLGGRDEKLRFYVLLLANGKEPFQEYQKQVVEREFPFWLEKENSEIERLTIADRYVELLLLIPVRAKIQLLINKVVSECNEYGNFLSSAVTISNVKEFSEEEIAAVLEKNEKND